MHIIITLKAELEKSSYDKVDLKEIHKNYIMQMQTLIKKGDRSANSKKRMSFM